MHERIRGVADYAFNAPHAEPAENRMHRGETNSDTQKIQALIGPGTYSRAIIPAIRVRRVLRMESPAAVRQAGAGAHLEGTDSAELRRGSASQGATEKTRTP